MTDWPPRDFGPRELMRLAARARLLRSLTTGRLLARLAGRVVAILRGGRTR